MHFHSYKNYRHCGTLLVLLCLERFKESAHYYFLTSRYVLSRIDTSYSRVCSWRKMIIHRHTLPVPTWTFRCSLLLELFRSTDEPTFLVLLPWQYIAKWVRKLVYGWSILLWDDADRKLTVVRPHKRRTLNGQEVFACTALYLSATAKHSWLFE